MREELQLIVLKGLEGNEATHLSGIQPYLHQHSMVIVTGWWCVYLLVAITVITLGVREYIKMRK